MRGSPTDCYVFSARGSERSKLLDWMRSDAGEERREETTRMRWFGLSAPSVPGRSV